MAEAQVQDVTDEKAEAQKCKEFDHHNLAASLERSCELMIQKWGLLDRALCKLDPACQKALLVVYKSTEPVPCYTLDKDITLFRLPPGLTSSDSGDFNKAYLAAQDVLTKGGVGAIDRRDILEGFASQRGMLDDMPEEKRPAYYPMMWLDVHPFVCLKFAPDNDLCRQIYAVSTAIPVNHAPIEQYGLFDFLMGLMANEIYADKKRRLCAGQTLYYDYLIEGIRLTLFLKV